MSCVSERSQLSRSVISPDEQLGKHQAGASGWRAAEGRGGTAGIGGNESEDVVPQAARNIVGSSSITRQLGASLTGLIGHLLDCLGAAALFLPRRLDGLGLGPGLGLSELGDLPLGDPPPGDPPSGHQDGRQGHEQNEAQGDHGFGPPMAFWPTLAAP